jgi:hypothetical protein
MPLKSRVDQILRSCCALVGARGDARKVENGKGRRRVGVRFERLPARVMLTASPGESGGTGGGELLAEFSPLIAPTPPTVAVGAAAFSSTVTGTSTNLSVLGADNAGEASLTYTWSTTATPGAGVVFSSNGSNAAKDVTATFSLAGNYSFLVTITDGSGGSVTSSVNVTVDQTFTSIAVSPGAGSVYVNQNRHFHATALDQFGTAMALQPTFDWTLASGAGSIAGDGDFTAAGVAGSTVVEAISGSIGGTATITVLDTAPTITDPASAFPGTVTGTTTDLSVNEGDDGGSGNLIYTWSVLSKPSGAISPTFSENGDNNASNSTATFYAAGSYQIQATVMDASGLSATSDVTVVVSQTLTSIAINPSSPTVLTGGTQQLTATGLDQFGAVMASEPTFFWTASGGGSVSSGGLYTAPGSAATATVTAWAEFIHASATMFVVQTPAITASPGPRIPTHGRSRPSRRARRRRRSARIIH